MQRSPRLVIGAILVLALGAAAFASRQSRFAFASADQLLVIAQSSGAAGWAVFFLAQAVVAALGVLPASLLAMAAGLAYGVWLGFLLSAAATLLGGWTAFILSRSLLRPWIGKIVLRHHRICRLDEAVVRDGWKFVCLLRMSPVMPFAATSYCLGLTGLGHRPFLLGSLASLPALLCYVSLGAFARSGLSLAQDGATTLQPLFLLVGAASTIIIAVRVRKMLSASLSATTDFEGGVESNLPTYARVAKVCP